MSGILDTYPRARWRAYVTSILIGLALGAVAAYCATIGDGVPKVVVGLLGAHAFLSAGLGLTAASNVPDGKPPKVIDLLEPYRGEHRAE